MNEEKLSFKELGLSGKILRVVESLGFEEPTPVQHLSIPIILKEKNLIAQAPTGTGKTLAFGLPIVEKIDKKSYPNALILVPTRELCIQVAQELNKIGRKVGVFSIPIYGGHPIEKQISALKKGFHIIVGTPGRVIDHINRRTLNFSKVSFLVLDEADEMLDMGFQEDIETILKTVPEGAKRYLFSATMPPQILKMADKYIKDYEKVTLSSKNIIVPTIKQIFYEVKEQDKMDVLSRILDNESDGLVLIFCHTKKETDEVAYTLKNRGYQAEAIHGDYSQAQRERVMEKFKTKKINILVATDVAARGLDISDVTHVINFSIPQNPESYIHRIGRTGRAGKSGVAITLVTPREYERLRQIERLTKSKLKKEAPPELSELIEIKKESFVKSIEDTIKKEKKLIKDLAGYFEDMLGEYSLGEILSASFILKEGLSSPAKPLREEKGEYKRLFITLGSKDGISAKDIFKSLIEKADLTGEDIGKITIKDNFTFVEVKEKIAEKVIGLLEQIVVKGKEGKVMRAKK
ncbi:MAG: DEAD/DEAH box helicase [Proteobacteria bacterium]|nr:DEAD/DEAH box helicase [Pseudomonadota bacterium]